MAAAWDDMLPPVELTQFLKEYKLQYLDVKLCALGYDDVDDFQNFDEVKSTLFVACARCDAIGAYW